MIKLSAWTIGQGGVHGRAPWLSCVVVWVVTSSAALAAPPAPLTSYTTQSDGTLIEVQLAGDENGHWIETASGHTLVHTPGGEWAYLLPDGSTAQDIDPSAIPMHLLPEGVSISEPHRPDPTAQLPLGVVASGVGNPIEPFKGSVALLVIMGYYDDALSAANCASCAATPPVEIHDLAFANPIRAHTVSGYYNNASDGKFRLEAARESYGAPDDGIVGWLRLGAQTPEGTAAALSIYKSNRIAADAISAARPYVDFTVYDTDGNGVVTPKELAIVIVLAGYESAYGADERGRLLADDDSSPRVWAHSMGFRPTSTGISSPTQTLNGRTVTLSNTNGRHAYTIVGERQGNHAATMGLLTHELGHLIFDLPDLYDVTRASSGVGVWSLMGYGTWGATPYDAWPGETPALPDAWVRVSLGWMTPLHVTSTMTIETVSADQAGATIIRVDSPNPHEYFLIENRQNSGYDAGLWTLLGGDFGGIALWHIDDGVGTAGYNNDNANAAHKRVDLIAAVGDGLLDAGTSYGHPANLFYDGNIDRIDQYTDPNTNLYTGNASGFSVSSVSYSGPTMTIALGPGAPTSSKGGGGALSPGAIFALLLTLVRLYRRRATD